MIFQVEMTDVTGVETSVELTDLIRPITQEDKANITGAAHL